MSKDEDTEEGVWCWPRREQSQGQKLGLRWGGEHARAICPRWVVESPHARARGEAAERAQEWAASLSRGTHPVPVVESALKSLSRHSQLCFPARPFCPYAASSTGPKRATGTRWKLLRQFAPLDALCFSFFAEQWRPAVTHSKEVVPGPAFRFDPACSPWRLLQRFHLALLSVLGVVAIK